MEEFDYIVIGSGPGGYVSAIRAAQLGLKVAIVEKYNTLGGTCLNVGCIPSKAWLESSERFYDLNHHFKDHGIEVSNIKLDFNQMRSRVQNVVSQTCQGIQFLMKKNKIKVFHGHGTFKDPHTISVQGKESSEIKGKSIVIATGSKPVSLPGIEINKKNIITSTEALYLENLPQKMTIIGGGVIGLELGQVYLRLGCEVQVVEYAANIIEMMDSELGKNLLKVLKKQGMKFLVSHQVLAANASENEVQLKVKDLKSDKEVSLTTEICLMAVGRKAYTDNLGLENIGLELDERGRIPTQHNQTKLNHIYAIGDVTTGVMLAHKAEEEGVYVAEVVSGQKPIMNHDLIPGVIYTWPEVASVGATEADLKAKGIPFKKGSFPFKASGRARAANESEGFIKVLAHEQTDEILGVHMFGPRASDMIAEAVLAMEYKASAEDVARVCHAHPTYTESFKEACLAATENRALHF